jgi:hypothetical protein
MNGSLRCIVFGERVDLKKKTLWMTLASGIEVRKMGYGGAPEKPLMSWKTVCSLGRFQAALLLPRA